MRLPEFDEGYLNEKGYDWELIPGNGQGFLVLKNFTLTPGRFDRGTTDLMIRIPNGYNMTKLDMFYVDPPIRLAGTNNYPDRAGVFEKHAEREWQRSSRHLPNDAWKPGVDNVRSFLTFVTKELRAG